MPTISRRQFTAAFGGISVAALAASATTLPAAAEPGGGELDPLRSMRVPRGLRTADGPIWSATATGFAGLPTPELPHGTDRKSTRLNSSHVAISYAVFCLKKKKYWTLS